MTQAISTPRNDRAQTTHIDTSTLLHRQVIWHLSPPTKFARSHNDASPDRTASSPARSMHQTPGMLRSVPHNTQNRQDSSPCRPEGLAHLQHTTLSASSARELSGLVIRRREPSGALCFKEMTLGQRRGWGCWSTSKKQQSHIGTQLQVPTTHRHIHGTCTSGGKRTDKTSETEAGGRLQVYGTTHGALHEALTEPNTKPRSRSLGG